MGNVGYVYEYDVMGNITQIKEGTRKAGTDTTIENAVVKVQYEYDSQNQLVRENNKYLNKTIVYDYDNGGNILSRTEYAYTTAADLSSKTPTDTIVYGYSTSWKDQMISYDGQSITYDAIGNPTSYRGKTMSWNGRELESLTQSGSTIRYEYDSDGMRTSKTVGGVKTEYYYSDGKLLYEATKKVLEASISIYKDNPRMLGAALYTIPRG